MTAALYVQLCVGLSAFTAIVVAIVVVISGRGLSLGRALALAAPFFVFGLSAAVDVDWAAQSTITAATAARWTVTPLILVGALYLLKQLAAARERESDEPPPRIRSLK